MTCKQKSSWRAEYSISSGVKIACRISSLLKTRPDVRRANSLASVDFPLPGRPAMRTIMIGNRKRCGGEEATPDFETVRTLLRSGAEGNFCGRRFRFVLVGMLHRHNGLGLAPLRIVPADHNVEAPVVPFFFRFHQAERFHVKEIMLDPTYLILAQAPALQVDRYARQMR